MSEQRKGRLMLLFLLVAFSLPVIIGLYLYSTHQLLGGKGHGELIQPPRKLTSISTVDWQGKWHMVYVSGAACDETCNLSLRMMRQVHVSLAKDIDRVQRVWVINGVAKADELLTLRQQYPDLLVLNESGGVAQHFGLSDGTLKISDGSVYLVDPLGNLMMRYPRGADPKGIRKDLIRLLTYSWTG